MVEIRFPLSHTRPFARVGPPGSLGPGRVLDKRSNYAGVVSSCPGWSAFGGTGRMRCLSKIRHVFVLIIGCGRVGSSVARTMLREGHEVSCLDEDPEAHARLEVNLEKSWEDSGGQFTVGTGLEEEALIAAGIERADAFIASTDGDNTNIVISQIAKRRFNVPTVIARILDPLRAEWYEKQGVNTVCPTRIAIEMLEKEVLEAAASGSGSS